LSPLDSTRICLPASALVLELPGLPGGSGFRIPETEDGARLPGEEVSGDVPEPPDVSPRAFGELIVPYVKRAFKRARDLGETAGKRMFSGVVWPGCVWWGEMRLRDKIVMGLLAACVLFVLGLFLFGT